MTAAEKSTRQLELERRTWTELDTESGDHFAVCFGDGGYSIEPDAIFRSREDADAYAAWRLAQPDTDDRYTPREFTTLVVRDLAGVCWNSYDPVPEDGGAREGSSRALTAEVERLTALLNTPEVHSFTKAAVLEALHQHERWPSDHDAGKTNEDWFWLVGYLAGKALRDSDPEKRLHRVVTVAAAACNWHAALMGSTSMRPGLGAEVAQAIDGARGGA